ncbi:MAG: hypothetical protein ABIS59_03555, partial [Candidatus Saccharibacteria bacterium]
SIKSLVLEDAVIAALRESKSLLTTKELAAKCGTCSFTHEVICRGDHFSRRVDITACVLTGESIQSTAVDATPLPLALHTVNRAVMPRDIYHILARLIRENRIMRLVIENNGSAGWMISELADEIDLEAIWLASNDT